MDQIEIIKVKENTETIYCDGGENSLGHPTVYFTFGNENKIICNYCGRTFIKKAEEN